MSKRESLLPSISGTVAPGVSDSAASVADLQLTRKRPRPSELNAIVDLEMIKIGSIGLKNIEQETCHIQLYTLSESHRALLKEKTRMEKEIKKNEERAEEYKRRYEAFVTLFGQSSVEFEQKLLQFTNTCASPYVKGIPFTFEPFFRLEKWDSRDIEEVIKARHNSNARLMETFTKALAKQFSKPKQIEKILISAGPHINDSISHNLLALRKDYSRMEVSVEANIKKSEEATARCNELNEINFGLQTTILQHVKDLADLKYEISEIRRMYEKLQFRFAWYVKYEHGNRKSPERKDAKDSEQVALNVESNKSVKEISHETGEKVKYLQKLNEERQQELEALTNRNKTLAGELENYKNMDHEISSEMIFKTPEYKALRDKCNRYLIEFGYLKKEYENLSALYMTEVERILEGQDEGDVDIAKSRNLMKKLIQREELFQQETFKTAQKLQSHLDLIAPKFDISQAECKRQLEYIDACTKKKKIMKLEVERSRKEKDAMQKRISKLEKELAETRNRCYRCRWIETDGSAGDCVTDFEKLQDVNGFLETASHDELKEAYVKAMNCMKGIRTMYHKVQTAKKESLEEWFKSDEHLKTSKTHDDTIQKLKEELERSKQNELSYSTQFEETDAELEKESERCKKIAKELTERENINFTSIASIYEAKEAQAKSERKVEVVRQAAEDLGRELELQKIHSEHLEEEVSLVRGLLKNKHDELLSLHKEYNFIDRNQAVLVEKIRTQEHTIQSIQEQKEKIAENNRVHAENEEAYLFNLKRCEERENVLKKKYDKAKISKKSENTSDIDSLMLQINKYKDSIKCSCCKTNPKDTIITKCFHLFCRSCVNQNIESRKRKCPTCGVGFGSTDIKPVSIS
uniref:E3 ubiquitin protein ligase n=1 Tax=Rhabditophanes sp. KR3021 TaxID=114890 RepID=A0AC35UCA3_9BILA